MSKKKTSQSNPTSSSEAAPAKHSQSRATASVPKTNVEDSCMSSFVSLGHSNQPISCGRMSKESLVLLAAADYATLLREMVKLGYHLEWRVFDTRWFGIPQSRNRVYLVGHLLGRGAGSVLFEREGDRGNTSSYSEAKQYGEYNPRRDVKFTETKAIGNGRSVVGCLCARDYKGIGSDCVTMGKVIMETDLLSAETTLRRLTPVEYERLQGFPDNWTRIEWNGKPASQCPLGHRYKAMGNTMSVPVVRWIGERIAEHYRDYRESFGEQQ